MTIAKKCIGCQSNKSRYGSTYNACRLNIGLYRNYKHRTFRDQYCPCVECLVKVTCTEPKTDKLNGIMPEVYIEHHKCNLLKDQIDKFTKYIFEGK